MRRGRNRRWVRVTIIVIAAVAALIAALMIVVLGMGSGWSSPVPKPLDRVPEDAVLAVAISPDAATGSPFPDLTRGRIAFVGGTSSRDWMTTRHPGEYYNAIGFSHLGTVGFSDRDSTYVLGDSLTEKARGPATKGGSGSSVLELKDGSFAYMFNVGFGSDGPSDYHYGVEFSNDHPGLDIPYQINSVGVCDGIITGVKTITTAISTGYQGFQLFTVGSDLRTIHPQGNPIEPSYFGATVDQKTHCLSNHLYIRRVWYGEFEDTHEKIKNGTCILTEFDTRTGKSRNTPMKYHDGRPVIDARDAETTTIHNGKYIWHSERGQVYATDPTTGLMTLIVDTKLKGGLSRITYTAHKIYALDTGGSMRGHSQLRIYSLDTGQLLQTMATPSLDRALKDAGNSYVTSIAAKPDD